MDIWKLSNDAKTILKKVSDDGYDIFEKVSDDAKDILEKVSNYGGFNPNFDFNPIWYKSKHDLNPNLI